MKILRMGLRSWITLASLASFVGGWVTLVHAPKPFQVSKQSVAAPLPTLEPLPPLSTSGPVGPVQDQPLFNVQPRVRSSLFPFFRTSGS